jgi:pilus assembly protein Flp/PilA
MVQSSIQAIRRAADRFLSNEHGATSVEYALIASGVSIVILGTVVTLGSNVKGFYQSVSTALK